MHRLILLVALCLTGCANVNGPLQHYFNPQRVDDPHLSIPEQEVRGRDRLALPEFGPNVAPRTYAEFPGPHGR